MGNVKLKDILDCNYHEMVYFKIFGVARRVHSKHVTLNFRIAEFVLSRDPLMIEHHEIKPCGEEGPRQEQPGAVGSVPADCRGVGLR